MGGGGGIISSVHNFPKTNTNKKLNEKSSFISIPCCYDKNENEPKNETTSVHQSIVHFGRLSENNTSEIRSAFPLLRGNILLFYYSQESIKSFIFKRELA